MQPRTTKLQSIAVASSFTSRVFNSQYQSSLARQQIRSIQSLATPRKVFLVQQNGLQRKQQTRSIRSIMKPPIFNRFDHAPELPRLEASQAASRARRAKSMPLRTGVLGRKKGMSVIFDSDTGVRTPVTLVQMDVVQVMGVKTTAKHGYCAVQVGHGNRKPTNISRAMQGVYEQSQLPVKREIVEFMVKDESGLPPIGTILKPSWFREGDFVNAKSNCKGKGFAGGMKRHGMAGQPASHGTSLTHRALGSAGQSQGGGSRVYPGKRMAGRMGGQQVTVHNCKILQVDDANGLIVLHGCIAGPNGTTVKLQDAWKKKWPDVPSVPPELLADGAIPKSIAQGSKKEQRI